MSTENPLLEKVTYKHIFLEDGRHFVERRVETPSSDKTVHADDCGPTEKSIIFLGNHILVGLPAVDQDRYPTLDVHKVHVFRYGGSYATGEWVPDPTDKVAQVLELLKQMDDKETELLSDKIGAADSVPEAERLVEYLKRWI